MKLDGRLPIDTRRWNEIYSILDERESAHVHAGEDLALLAAACWHLPKTP
jgi:hypothetical protein